LALIAVMAMPKCEYEAIAWQYLPGQYINAIASHTAITKTIWLNARIGRQLRCGWALVMVFGLGIWDWNAMECFTRL